MTAPMIRAVLELPAGALAMAAPEPLLVSQRTAEAMLGIPRRRYLALAAEYRAGGGEVLCTGRLRLVEPTAFVGWLRQRAERGNGAERDPNGEVADVLAGVGLRLIGGSR